MGRSSGNRFIFSAQKLDALNFELLVKLNELATLNPADWNLLTCLLLRATCDLWLSFSCGQL